jgi:hypothetical protein
LTSIADKVIALHHALTEAELPHAFGGALALAWCTEQPRGTSDIDLNVFVPTSSVARVLDALPPEVARDRPRARVLEREGQVRLRWDDTPIDLFLNTSSLHEDAMQRVSLEPFVGEMLPFLACDDLAVFKAFLARRRDWADIEDMITARSVDVDAVVETLSEHVGPDDERIITLRTIETEHFE